MMLLIDHLRMLGKRTVVFNLVIEADHQFFDSQEGLLRKIRLELGTGKAMCSWMKVKGRQMPAFS